jgi:alpha-tubulin suppressor-like RCC1 family protein
MEPFFHLEAMGYYLNLFKYGQLGLGDSLNRLTPTKNYLISNIISVSSGEFHSLALNKSGSVFSFGYNIVFFFI